MRFRLSEEAPEIEPPAIEAQVHWLRGVERDDRMLGRSKYRRDPVMLSDHDTRLIDLMLDNIARRIVQRIVIWMLVLGSLFVGCGAALYYVERLQ